MSGAGPERARSTAMFLVAPLVVVAGQVLARARRRG